MLLSPSSQRLLLYSCKGLRASCIKLSFSSNSRDVTPPPAPTKADLDALNRLQEAVGRSRSPQPFQSSKDGPLFLRELSKQSSSPPPPPLSNPPPQYNPGNSYSQYNPQQHQTNQQMYTYSQPQLNNQHNQQQSQYNPPNQHDQHTHYQQNQHNFQYDQPKQDNQPYPDNRSPWQKSREREQIEQRERGQREYRDNRGQRDQSMQHLPQVDEYPMPVSFRRGEKEQGGQLVPRGRAGGYSYSPNVDFKEIHNVIRAEFHARLRKLTERSRELEEERRELEQKIQWLDTAFNVPRSRKT